MSDVPISSRGYFWRNEVPIPEGKSAPELAKPGTLDIDQAGVATLKLDANLPHSERKPIQGILAGRNLYILLLSPIWNGSTTSSGLSSQEWIAHRSLTSPVAFSPTAAPTFQSAELPLAGFEDWLALKSIKVKQTKFSITARYVRSRDLKWMLKIGTLMLKLQMTHPWRGEYASASFRQIASLQLDLKSAVDIEKAESLLQRLHWLLILFTDSDRDPEFPIVRTKPDGPPIRLYSSRSRTRAEQVRWNHCWMCFPELGEHFGEYVESWLQKATSIGPGVDLYLASRWDDLSIEHRFATLVWGLESLHRKKIDKIAARDPDQPPTKLQKKIDRILKGINLAKDKKWAQSQFEHAAEPTLATRLHDIFKKLPLQFDPTKMTDFTKAVADRRNDLSHFGGIRQSGDEYATFVRDVARFSEALDLLYHAILLLEIGIPESMITCWLTNSFCSGLIGPKLEAAGIPMKNKKPRTDLRDFAKRRGVEGGGRHARWPPVLPVEWRAAFVQRVSAALARNFSAAEPRQRWRSGPRPRSIIS